jgi:hypothetical protein
MDMCWILWQVFQGTHIYQQDFHVAPNPKKIIQLDASGKQGRYPFKNLPSVLPSTA